MPPSTRIRNDRNNPYLFDGLFGQVHRSAAGSIWRWRTEFTAVTSVAAGTGWLVHATTVTLSVLTLAGTAGGRGPRNSPGAPRPPQKRGRRGQAARAPWGLRPRGAAEGLLPRSPATRRYA